MYRLRSYEVSPPGGFPYIQPGSPSRNFPAQPMIEAQARIVLSFRLGNGLPRATYSECIQDIDQFTCARLGNPASLCILCGDTPSIALAANAPGLVPCATCGAPVT